MKAKIIKSVSFILIGLLIFTILFETAKKKYPKYYNRKKTIRRAINKGSIKALLLGTSHANSTRLPALGFSKKTGLKINHGGADFFEIDHQIRSLVPYFPKLEVVFMSMSYFSFSYDNAAWKNKSGVNDRAGKRRRLYATHPSWKYIPGDFSNMVLGKLYPIFTKDHWETVFKEMFTKSGISTTPARRKKSVKTREQMILSLNSDGKKRVNNVLNRIKVMKKNRNSIEQDTFNILSNLIKYLNARQIKVIFITPPYWKTYNDLFPEFYKTLLAGNMEQIQKKIDVKYYNFSQYQYFQEKPGLFTNADHLNAQGFKVFSPILRQTYKKNAKN